VINADYGGFSLSRQGLEAYAKRKGIEKLYWFSLNLSSMDYKELVPLEEGGDSIFAIAYTVPNPDNNTKSFSNRDMKRDDPDLVAVVEELGHDAGGRYAYLRVVEIPSDVQWSIEEYDGLEWVSEEHRTWR
jgi:hypothetical protein